MPVTRLVPAVQMGCFTFSSPAGLDLQAPAARLLHPILIQACSGDPGLSLGVGGKPRDSAMRLGNQVSGFFS